VSENIEFLAKTFLLMVVNFEPIIND